MNKTLEGMARAICLAIWDHDYTPRDPLHPDARWLQAMKAANAGAGFLADNVSDEMVLASIMLPNDPMAEKLKAAFKNSRHADTIERTRASISRALRAAAGSATPEVK